MGGWGCQWMLGVFVCILGAIKLLIGVYNTPDCPVGPFLPFRSNRRAAGGRLVGWVVTVYYFFFYYLERSVELGEGSLGGQNGVDVGRVIKINCSPLALSASRQ